MLVIGKTDTFEQRYMAKFEKIASEHGVFVKYERDRAARDIGLHLTKKMESDNQRVSGALIWFQMKGIMATTLSKDQFQKDGEVRLPLSVEHLRHWFLEKEPTHLCVYVEAADVFLICNIQAYISSKWGRDILKLNQQTATVSIPASSELDDQAFSILLRHADIAQWSKALDVDHTIASQLHRDYNLIYSLGSAKERNVKHGIVWTKWLSKTRHQLAIVELSESSGNNFDDDGINIHEHWEFGGINIVESYPYLELFKVDDYEPEVQINRWGEEEMLDDGELFVLPNGEEVFGPNAANEYCEFVIGATLNQLGQDFYKHVLALVQMGLLELRPADSESRTFVSIAPWHQRQV